MEAHPDRHFDVIIVGAGLSGIGSACHLTRECPDKSFTVLEGMTPGPWTDFQAGYITRVLDQLPRQGDRAPWTNIQDYKRDKTLIGKAPIDDGHMEFGHAQA